MLAANGLADNGNPTALQVWHFDRSNVFHVGSFALPYQAYDFDALRFGGGPRLSLGGAKTLDGTPFAMSPASDILAVTIEAELSNYTVVMRLSLMFDVQIGRASCRERV